MRVTVSGFEPLILRDAQPGDLFLLHVAQLDESVFALLRGTSSSAAADHLTVVCMGSRVGPGERGRLLTGVAVTVPMDSAITLLDQVEPAAFRSRPMAGQAPVIAPHTTGNQTLPESPSHL